MSNKTVLLFDNDRSLVVTDLNYTTKGFTCWVVNGAYWLKWENNTVYCCREIRKQIKSKNSWDGWTWKIYPDWENPVTIIPNIPFPTSVTINFNDDSNHYYNEIIAEAIKYNEDPDNYVPIQPEKPLTKKERESMIPF